jgi:ABC-type uncharacterized transport system permease subunit
MIQGVSLICFAASYLVSLVLELTRFYFRATVRNVVMLGFAVAGLVAHSLFLLAEAQRGMTLTSGYHVALVVAWLLAAWYLAITLWPTRTAWGLLVLPTILALIGVAHLFPRESVWTSGQAAWLWTRMHAGALLVGTASAVIGFLAGLMYLAQSRQLKRKKPWPYRLRLPTLEGLQHTNEASLIVSCCSLVAGLVFGVILNVSRSPQARIAWRDPVIWTSAILLVWLVLALLFNALYRPARRGRKVAYLTVVSFVFLSLVLGMLLWAPSQHTRGGSVPAEPAERLSSRWAPPGCLGPDARTRAVASPIHS